MILVIGEILFDIFKDEKRLGGAPFNFAYHLNKLGFPVRYISRIGNDTNGNEIIDRLKQHHFNIDDIQIDDEHDTGTVAVQLNSSGTHSFNIVPDVAYDHINYLPEKHLPLIEKATLIYFGTLVQRSDKGFKTMQHFLTPQRSETICFYDINLRPACYTDTIIDKSLRFTNFLKLNDEELIECKRICRREEDDDAFIPYLMHKYSLNTVALTMGKKGSRLFTEDGYFDSKTAHKVKSIVDTVGAGDAYASMLAAGTLKGWQPDKTLSMASMFAARICEIRGAIPESPAFYEPIRDIIET